ncbi:hypothetical protein [Pyramidobacter sp. CG50-2]|uniref:hypothetical protein n=1 Tax=Pyramidobacter sp. CG50-2 TaxID=2382160 RepID=UPI000EC2A67F|nr:hypothetical protein [Pyramidobacter sp. CG50-2]RKJ79111.1 hypothetical protein D7D26_05500 [Pyramidobacter sp. CG50-2]
MKGHLFVHYDAEISNGETRFLLEFVPMIVISKESAHKIPGTTQTVGARSSGGFFYIHLPANGAEVRVIYRLPHSNGGNLLLEKHFGVRIYQCSAYIMSICPASLHKIGKIARAAAFSPPLAM